MLRQQKKRREAINGLRSKRNWRAKNKESPRKGLSPQQKYEPKSKEILSITVLLISMTSMPWNSGLKTLA
jgi:hypothetical protein